MGTQAKTSSAENDCMRSASTRYPSTLKGVIFSPCTTQLVLI